MPRVTARTPAEYLESLPAEKRAVIASMRKVVNKHIAKGYKESMNWGAITWEVPLSRFPKTYNGKPLCYVSLAAHKSYATLYLMGAYTPENLRVLQTAFAKSGKKLDLGKSCLRFKRVEDLELEAIGKVIARFTPDEWIQVVERSRGAVR